jgi:beta-glucosidase-like glycosyl hydrolase
MAGLEQPLIVPAIRLDRDAAAEEAKALERAKAPWVAGFCLFGGEAEAVRALVLRLREAAGRPIFVASDMERGAGQQVEGLRTLPDLAVLGLAGTVPEAEAFGTITARDARSVGIDVLFAPVLDVRSEPDNPIVGNRAIGYDPDRVATLGAAFCRGALDGGALPVAKHYPGHGATRGDSHDSTPTVDDRADLVRERDLAPFLRAVEEGCPAVMTAHVAYSSLDPSGDVATFSRPILAALREHEKAKDLIAVFTDALMMAGALAPGGEAEAARRALVAGCDALLIPEDPERLAATIGERDGWQSAAEVAADRLSTLTEAAENAGGSEADDGAVDAAPLRVADRAFRLQGGYLLDPEEPSGCVVVLDDDAEPTRGRALAERARASGVDIYALRVPKEGALPAIPDRIVPTTIVVMSSVRAWKGSSRVSARCAELYDKLFAASKGRAQSAWLTPRAPTVPYAVHLPGTGPDVEAVLADRLFGD